MTIGSNDVKRKIMRSLLVKPVKPVPSKAHTSIPVMFFFDNLLQWLSYDVLSHLSFVLSHHVLPIYLVFSIASRIIFIKKTPTPQNGQTHSNSSSAVCRQFSLSVFDHFVGLALKRLILHQACSSKQCLSKVRRITN